MRNGHPRGRWSVLLVAVALVATACRGGADTTTSTAPATATPTTSAPATTATAAPTLDLPAAAAALTDPASGVDAVVAILDVLAIGVYDVDGTPIAPGAERGNDDLWLSTAEVTGLAEAARRDPVPFSRMADLLDGLAGTDLTPEQVAEMYRTMVETLPDHPMSRVLQALGTDLRADGAITPFEGWLLLVAMTPPATLDGPQALGGRLPAGAAAAVTARAEDCPPVGGDGADPGYPIAQDYVGKVAGGVEGAVVDELAEGGTGQALPIASRVAGWWKTVSSGLGHVAKLLDVTKMWAIYEAIEPSLDVSKVPVHEVHDAQGKTVEDERAEIVATVRWKGLGAGKGRCFASRALSLPQPGPLENAGVKFTIDDVLVTHGYLRRPSGQNTARQLTDASGKARAWYEPKNERPKAAQFRGKAFEKRETGTVTAEFDFAGAFSQFLNPYGSIEAVFDAFDVNTIEYPLPVVWHTGAARVHAEYTIPGWSGALTVDLASCDGETWTGAVDMDLTLRPPEGGSVTQTGSAPVEVVVDADRMKGSVEFDFPQLLTAHVAGTTATDDKIARERLTLTLPEGDGPATIGLEELGGQGVVSGGGMTFAHGIGQGAVEVQGPIEPNGACES